MFVPSWPSENESSNGTITRWSVELRWIWHELWAEKLASYNFGTQNWWNKSACFKPLLLKLETTRFRLVGKVLTTSWWPTNTWSRWSHQSPVLRVAGWKWSNLFASVDVSRSIQFIPTNSWEMYWINTSNHSHKWVIIAVSPSLSIVLSRSFIKPPVRWREKTTLLPWTDFGTVKSLSNFKNHVEKSLEHKFWTLTCFC